MKTKHITIAILAMAITTASAYAGGTPPPTTAPKITQQDMTKAKDAAIKAKAKVDTLKVKIRSLENTADSMQQNSKLQQKIAQDADNALSKAEKALAKDPSDSSLIKARNAALKLKNSTTRLAEAAAKRSATADSAVSTAQEEYKTAKAISREAGAASRSTAVRGTIAKVSDYGAEQIAKGKAAFGDAVNKVKISPEEVAKSKANLAKLRAQNDLLKTKVKSLKATADSLRNNLKLQQKVAADAENSLSKAEKALAKNPTDSSLIRAKDAALRLKNSTAKLADAAARKAANADKLVEAAQDTSETMGKLVAEAGGKSNISVMKGLATKFIEALSKFGPQAAKAGIPEAAEGVAGVLGAGATVVAVLSNPVVDALGAVWLVSSGISYADQKWNGGKLESNLVDLLANTDKAKEAYYGEADPLAVKNWMAARAKAAATGQQNDIEDRSPGNSVLSGAYYNSERLNQGLSVRYAYDGDDWQASKKGNTVTRTDLDTGYTYKDKETYSAAGVN